MHGYTKISNSANEPPVPLAKPVYLFDTQIWLFTRPIYHKSRLSCLDSPYIIDSNQYSLVM